MSSSEEESNRELEDEQFYQAFGEHTGIDEEVRGYVNKIRNNNHDVNKLVLRSDHTNEFTDLARRLLGRYIANNTHLEKLDLDESGLTDEQIIPLFSELTSSKSLDRLDLDDNAFGIQGVRSMLPLLQNSPHISNLYLSGNSNFNSECFEGLASALDGKSITLLYLLHNNIEDISALDRYSLPNLQKLCLNNNNIGREGCITLSNLLQKEDTSLKHLYLDDTGINDEGAEILAASLKHNAKLETLSLVDNNLTNEAYDTFLKLVVDISSIENTYSSNHILETCNLDRYDDGNTYDEIQSLINNACKENKFSSTPDAAGRAKVIKYHLNSQNMMKLCEFQDIEYIPGSVFADIEPVLLPKILSLIGQKNGQSELYSALIQTAPDLLSYIDRKALIDRTMAKNTAQTNALSHECAQKVAEYEQKIAEYEQKIAALKTEMLAETSRLTAENNELNNRRTLIDVGDCRQSATREGEGCDSGSRGKKRGRS